MILRRATTDDLPLITEWRTERAKWLDSIGSDQWSDAGITTAEFQARVLQSIQQGSTWIAEDGDRPVGTIAVDSEADAGLWSDAELSDALVVHRMIVPMEAQGRDVGSFLLGAAEAIARDAGKRRLILDAWNSNTRLHDYYKNQGFRYTGKKEDHWTPSSTLFEKALN